MRPLRLLLANLLARLASIVAGPGVQADTWIHEPLPPRGYQRWGVRHRTSGTVRVIYG